MLSPLVRESGFWNLGNYFLLVESGILGLGIWNTAQGIWISLTIGIRNPSSTDTDSRIKNLESGIHSMGSRISKCCGILGLGIWNTAQGIWISLTIGIRNPSSTDTDSRIKNLESGIHSMGSRISKCCGFPNIGHIVDKTWQ